MSSVIHASTYDIHIGNDTFIRLEKFLANKSLDGKIFILVDEHTKAYCLPLISERVKVLKGAIVVEMESGEKNKSLSSCEKLWLQLTDHKADRKTLLINLGGGMIGDVGGFVAATYMRGIDFINIPTTLLAMVDASVGGKNGINFSGLKNQVGTFTNPKAVFVSPSFLKTLPDREIKSGFAEVIKHALIADRDAWNELKQVRSLAESNWIRIIDHSVFLKNKIVRADFKERYLRKALNFGHTIGHALESYSMKHHSDPMKHGEAVAAGLLGEVWLSQKLLGFPAEDASVIIEFIQHHYPSIDEDVNVEEVLELIRSDKKNELEEVNFVLLRGLAAPVIGQKPGDELIREAIRFSTRRNSPVELNR